MLVACKVPPRLIDILQPSLCCQSKSYVRHLQCSLERQDADAAREPCARAASAAVSAEKKLPSHHGSVGESVDRNPEEESCG